MSDKEWFELDEGTPNTAQTTEEQDKTPVTEPSPQEPANEEDFGKLDAAKEEELDFWKMVEEEEKQQTGKQQKGKKKKNGCATGCGATSKVGKTATPTPPPPPKEPPKDLPLLVVLTNYNVQKEYPTGTTLEEVRQDLELEYPAYSANNTTWYFEEQRNKNRVLCIPSVKSNKAG